MRIDIVLQQNRDAVQWPAHLTAFALAVHGAGDLQRVGIQFDDGIDQWVNFFDAAQILPRERHRCFFPSRDRRLQVGDARFVEFGFSDRGHARRGHS